MQNNLIFTKTPPRKLEDLNLIDDFLFQEMLMQEDTGEEFCRILLGTILGRTIRNVKIIPQKSIPGIDTSQHGIRLDAYIEDLSPQECMPGAPMADASITSDIYDIEPHNTYEKASLPKRMRYYHALIDTRLLAKGADYAKLPKVTTIVILPYDPFGQNRMLYTFRMQCVEDTAVPYDDGSTEIFLYTKGSFDPDSSGKKLADMLNYIEKSVDDNVTNQDIETLHQLVYKVKHKQEVEINYMKSWEREQLIRSEGISQGKLAGEDNICRLIKVLSEQNRTSDILKAADDTVFRDSLLHEFGIE